MEKATKRKSSRKKQSAIIVFTISKKQWHTVENNGNVQRKEIQIHHSLTAFSEYPFS